MSSYCKEKAENNYAKHQKDIPALHEQKDKNVRVKDKTEIGKRDQKNQNKDRTENNILVYYGE